MSSKIFDVGRVCDFRAAAQIDFVCSLQVSNLLPIQESERLFKIFNLSYFLDQFPSRWEENFL